MSAKVRSRFCKAAIRGGPWGCKVNNFGVVMIKFVMFLPAIILIVGYGINVTLLYAFKTFQLQQAQGAAIAALSGWRSATVADPSNTTAATATRYNKAITEAEETVQYGLKHSTYKNFIGGQKNNIEFGQQWEDSDLGNAGRIDPYVWFFEETDCSKVTSVNGCPCKTRNGATYWAGPCARKVDEDEVSSLPPNAFYSRVALSDSVPFLFLFPSIMGQQTAKPLSQAMCVYSPRNIVALLDLSRKQTSMTHLPLERHNPKFPYYVSEFSFRLKSGLDAAMKNYCLTPGGAALAALGEPCFEGTFAPEYNPALTENNRPFKLGSASGLFRFVIRDNILRGKNLGADTGTRSDIIAVLPTIPLAPRQIHFREDYAEFSICTKASCASGEAEDYVIDAFPYASLTGKIAQIPSLPVDPVSGYYGPEPLTTYFDATKTLIDRFNEHGVPGDYFGFIGFDQQSDLPRRKIALTRTDEALGQTVPASGTEAARLRQLENVLDVKNFDGNEATRFRSRLEDFNLFPRVVVTNSSPKQSVYGMSYLAEALRSAYDMIVHSSTNGKNIENHVVLFSEGLTSCHKESSDETKCGITQNDYTAAYNEAAAIIKQYYVPNNIKLHVFSYSERTQPHTLLKPSSSGCMDDDTFRNSASTSESFVDSNQNGATSKSLSESQKMTPTQTTPSNSFHTPNQIYELVRETGGVWAPLREPCRDSKGNAVDIKDALDKQCKAAAAKNLTIVTKSDITDSALQAYVDDAGRLLCDPTGASVEDQAKLYVDSVLKYAQHVQVQ